MDLSRARQHLKRALQLNFEEQNKTKKVNAFGKRFHVTLNEPLYIKTSQGNVYVLALEEEITPPPENPLLCVHTRQFKGTIQHYFENEMETVMVVERHGKKQKLKQGTEVNLVVQTDCLHTQTDVYSIIAFGVKIATGSQVIPEIKERADVFTTNLKVLVNASETLNASEPFNIMVHQSKNLPPKTK